MNTKKTPIPRWLGKGLRNRKEPHAARRRHAATGQSLPKIAKEFIVRTRREGLHIASYASALVKCPTRKPWPQIALEMLLITRKWKVLPLNYLRQALYDTKTPYADQFLSFIPEPALFIRCMPVLSPGKFRIIVRNKFIFRELLDYHGAATSQLALWSYSGTLYGKDGVIRDDGSLSAALKGFVGGTLVLKCQLGARGENIHFLSVAESGSGPRLIDPDGKVYDYQRLHAWSLPDNDLLLEEKVVQHKRISEIYPDSVNTVRIVTLNFPDGRTEFLCALMRIGRNGSRVDNASAGGIHVHIDVARGELTELAYCKTENSVFPAHPDTGFVFRGTKLPFWSEILSTLDRLAKAIMQVHTVAWDVAITETGPLIIEGNPTWNPGTMERGSYPKGDLILAATEAWVASQGGAPSHPKPSGGPVRPEAAGARPCSDRRIPPRHLSRPTAQQHRQGGRENVRAGGDSDNSGTGLSA